VAAASRLPATLGTSLVVVLVLLAVVKPWAPAAAPLSQPGPASSGEPAAGGAGVARGAPPGENARATRAPDATIDPLTLRKQCRDPDVWRLVTIEQSRPLVGRSLLPITLVAATGPDDPNIVPQLVRTGELVAFGYCVPAAIHPDAAAAEAAVAIWAQVDGRVTVPLSDARVMDDALASVGEVYLAPPGGAPVPGSGAPQPTWPQGRYIFRIPGDSPASDPGWFAFSFTSTAVAAAVPAAP
jgi:hypothetical protein